MFVITQGYGGSLAVTQGYTGVAGNVVSGPYWISAMLAFVPGKHAAEAFMPPDESLAFVPGKRAAQGNNG